MKICCRIIGKSATSISIDKIEVEENARDPYRVSFTIGAKSLRTANVTKLLFDSGYECKFECPLMTNEFRSSGDGLAHAKCSLCNRFVCCQ